MDIYQLQRQIQDLRQEVNTISQVASQLQRSEANNAAQLQRLQQNEAIATQQLQTIQQLCNRLNQDVNVISNVAQQVTAQMFNRPVTSGQWGTWNQPTTGQFGAYSPSITTGLYSPAQFGTFGSQFGANRFGVSLSVPDYGASLSVPNYAANQQLGSFINQGMLGVPSNIGASTYTSNLATGYTPTSFAGISTAYPAQTSQFGTTGFASSQFAPYSTSQISAAAQPTTGLWSQPLTSAHSMGMYSF